MIRQIKHDTKKESMQPKAKQIKTVCIHVYHSIYVHLPMNDLFFVSRFLSHETVHEMFMVCLKLKLKSVTHLLLDKMAAVS